VSKESRPRIGYLRELTPEEVREHDERVKALYRSRSFVRNIAAVLMDTSIGNEGDTESGAMTKAKAIVRLLQDQGVLAADKTYM